MSEVQWLRLVLETCNRTLEDARTGCDPRLGEYIPGLEAVRELIQSQLDEAEAVLPIET